MTYLYLVADIYPNLEKRSEALAAYQELIEHSLAEPGCLLYDLVEDENNSNVWHMLEKWESKEVWDKHMESDHVLKMQGIEPEITAKPTVLHFLTEVR
jgi:quinol monooxygenase YgiN